MWNDHRVPKNDLVKFFEVVDVVLQLLAQRLGLMVADVGVLLQRQNTFLRKWKKYLRALILVQLNKVKRLILA